MPTVFTKNRERLIKHHAIIEFFTEVLAISESKDCLSGEHSSVDGTLIQAWAGHRSFVRKDDTRTRATAATSKAASRSDDTH